MKIKESMDKYYGTIKMKVASPKKDTTATFQTNVDIYTVTIRGGHISPLNIGGVEVPINLHTILFSSKEKRMGHSSVETTNMEDTLYVYPTIMKIIQLYVKAMHNKNYNIFGFTCTVAGDNERGSKRKIYELLFNRAKQFGFHRWKNQLIAIPADLYDRIKEYGFQKEDGTIVFDRELN